MDIIYGGWGGSYNEPPNDSKWGVQEPSEEKTNNALAVLDQESQSLISQNYLDKLAELQKKKDEENLEKNKRELKTSKIRKAEEKISVEIAIARKYLKTKCPDAYKEISHLMPVPHTNKEQFYAILCKAKRHYRLRLNSSLSITLFALAGIIAYPAGFLAWWPGTITTLSAITGIISSCCTWTYLKILSSGKNPFDNA